jgi:hypothetical protein
VGIVKVICTVLLCGWWKFAVSDENCTFISTSAERMLLRSIFDEMLALKSHSPRNSEVMVVRDALIVKLQLLCMFCL